ncbi:MAG: hypothetical protein Q9195_004963 [Heterodermia aff. obscurata]
MPKVRKKRSSASRASRSTPLSISNANAKKEPSESAQSGKRERLEKIERKSDTSPGPQRTCKNEDNNDIAVNSAKCVKAEEQNGTRSGSAPNVKVEGKRGTSQSPEGHVKDEDRSEDFPKLEQDERHEIQMGMLQKLEVDLKTEHKHEETIKHEPDFKFEQHDHAAAELTNGDASNYLIQAYISSSSDPRVTRLLSVPPDLTFDRLHGVLQVAFGWTNSHLHRFEITDSRDGSWGSARLLLLSPNPSALIGDLGPDCDESKWTLADVYEKPEWKDRAQIEYEYDMGDSWHHVLALLGRATPGTHAQFGAPDDAKVVCLSGQGHPVAEDCGSSIGWEDLKIAFKNPGRAGNRDIVKWYKDECLNGDPGGLDPYKWDILDTNDDLREAGFMEGQAL